MPERSYSDCHANAVWLGLQMARRRQERVPEKTDRCGYITGTCGDSSVSL